MKKSDIAKANELAGRLNAITLMRGVLPTEVITITIGSVAIKLNTVDPMRPIIADAVGEFINQSEALANAELAELGVDDATPGKVSDITGFAEDDHV